jgi:hypothetical protein
MIANGLAIRSNILSLEAELVRSDATCAVAGCTALFSSDAFPVNSDR